VPWAGSSMWDVVESAGCCTALIAVGMPGRGQRGRGARWSVSGWVAGGELPGRGVVWYSTVPRNVYGVGEQREWLAFAGDRGGEM
jgi:hypothetical protein